MLVLLLLQRAFAMVCRMEMLQGGARGCCRKYMFQGASGCCKIIERGKRLLNAALGCIGLQGITEVG